MNAQNFAAGVPLNYGGSLSTSGVAERLMCVPEDSESINLRSGLKIAFPAESWEVANAALSDIVSYSESVAITNSGGIAITLSKQAAQSLAQSRDDYLNALLSLERKWKAGGEVYTKELSEDLFDARNKLRIQTRRASVVPQRIYRIIDDLKLEKLQRDLSAGKKSGTPYSKVINQEYESVIKSSFKANPAWTNVLIISKKALSTLQKLSIVVTVVQVSKPAFDLFIAETAEQEEKALRQFFEVSGQAVGGGVGLAAGGALCGAITFSSAGVAALACGMVTVASIEASANVGKLSGQFAHQLIGPASLAVIRNLKAGSMAPIKKD